MCFEVQNQNLLRAFTQQDASALWYLPWRGYLTKKLKDWLAYRNSGPK
jgi:hypothetical protein